MFTSILATILALSAPAPEVLVSNLTSVNWFPASKSAASRQEVPYGATIRLLNEAANRIGEGVSKICAVLSWFSNLPGSASST